MLIFICAEAPKFGEKQAIIFLKPWPQPGFTSGHGSYNYNSQQSDKIAIAHTVRHRLLSGYGPGSRRTLAMGLFT